MSERAKGDQSEYAAFVRRILNAAARRYAASDPYDLVELVDLQRQVDETLRTAVSGLRDSGFSWAQIGEALGVSRQAAFQRWGVKAAFTEDERTEPDLNRHVDAASRDLHGALVAERFRHNPNARLS